MGFIESEIIKLKGKQVCLIDDLEDDTYIDDVYVCYSMSKLAGKEVTIDKIIDYSDNYRDTFRFFIEEDRGEYVYSSKMIKNIIKETPSEEIIQKRLSVKKGDMLRIKTPKEMKEAEGEYESETLCGIKISISIPDTTGIEGLEFIACDVIENRILPYYIKDEYPDVIITTDMVELVEEGFVDNLISKKENGICLHQEETKILDDLATMEEMKSKVNIKDFKKIIAGSLNLIPKDMKGVEQIIHQWAFNKKEIYRVFDRKFNLSKEVEFDKDENMMEQERIKMYHEFPGYYYVLKQFSNREFIKNQLEHTLDYDWNRLHSRIYKTGERISKILDEAFKNDKFNIYLSDIIAQNKIKGIVEVSIDPIEYLLMSLNVSGWSSCHTLHKVNQGLSYGCYSAGLFSYMCDSNSLIAFRHDDKMYEYKINKQKITAHSKNWRQMIWVTKDFKAFIASRQYPVEIEEISKTAREMLEEQISGDEVNWVHSKNDEKLKKVICDKKHKNIYPLHYNDILHGFSGSLCYEKGTVIETDMLEIGSYPACPVCGEEILTSQERPTGRKCNPRN